MCHQVQDLLRNPENRKILDGGDIMVGLNPEIGHVLMAYEDLPYAYSWPLSEGRLFMFISIANHSVTTTRI